VILFFIFILDCVLLSQFFIGVYESRYVVTYMTPYCSIAVNEISGNFSDLVIVNLPYFYIVLFEFVALISGYFGLC